MMHRYLEPTENCFKGLKWMVMVLVVVMMMVIMITMVMLMVMMLPDVDMGVSQLAVSGCVSPIWSEPPPLVGLLPRTPDLKPHCFISPFANPAAI